MRTKQERTCVSCGNEFITTNLRQVRCRKDCGRKLSGHSARAASRLSNDLTFVGVDGEGVDRPDGTHEYVMLSVGGRTLWSGGNALSLGSILSFLWECYTETPDAAFVGFFLGYDFIMWQKLLPEKLAWSLLTSAGIAARKSRVQSRANPFPDAVVWEGWEIDIMAGRRFKLRPHVHHKSDYTGRCRNRTCNVDLETTFDPLDPILVLGEMEWELDESVVEIPWNGWSHFTRRHHTAGQGKVTAEVSGWMYICDTGPFWQTSFLNVINPKGWGDNPVCTQAEYDLIVAGKDDRGHEYEYGDVSYYSDMQMYNVLENDILARVTERLNKGFMNDAIPIKIAKNDWYGPGRAAQLWMDQLHAKVADPVAVETNKSTGERFRVGSKTRTNECGLLNADVYQSMPTPFMEAARDSYYGGWFEQMVHGHVGDVWEYDINSAYPYIIASLPCLHTTGDHNGQYTEGTGNAYPREARRYTLVYAECVGSNPYIGTLPFRTKQGNILRPHHVKGWYWFHEIQASQAAGLIDTYEVEQWVSYLPCECTPPFNPDDIGIGRMYDLRLRAGKNSPEGKALKLVYNSAYGKTAQSIGSPKYSNPVYASLITAGCRTLILQAIASHPRGAAAVTMVATDGIYFTERHPTLSLSATELGLWDEVHKHGMTQLMPGVYWDDKTREAIGLGGAPTLKSRGVNAKDLAKQIHQLDGLFAYQQLNFGTTEYQWPTIQFTIKFQLTSAKLALQRGKWDDAGRVDHGATRSISANPGSKRMPEPYRDDDSGGIIRTRPYDQWEILESTPYSKAFGYQSAELDGPLDRDGRDPLAYFRDLING